ncbi:hypothetical protein ACOZFM_32870 [Streptomyces arboris]|uniref:hypothetical protein n=1 Tax=Streptomyces arboris TaxID=2600619 RepID=UPI003BF58773
MPPRKRSAGIAVTGVAALAVCAGLFSWWNTDLLGEAEFCEGVVDSADMDAVLGTRGRLSTVWSKGSEVPEVACGVKRESKFLGEEPMEVTLTTAVHEPDFQFQTHVWKNPSAMSYFSKGGTGAVSDERGWVLLPDACRDKVGAIYPARQRPKSDEVTVVEAVMNQGTADRAALARMLVKAAQRIADDAGCGTGDSPEAPEIQNPSDLSATDAAAVCQLPGFRIPQDALVRGEAEIGKEQTTGSIPGAWSCGLEFSGSAGAKIWFSAAPGSYVADGTLLNSDGFKDIPGVEGKVDWQRNAVVLKCEAKNVYFSMRWSNEYWDLDLDHDLVERIYRSMLQSFVDASGKKYQCPSVKLT